MVTGRSERGARSGSQARLGAFGTRPGNRSDRGKRSRGGGPAVTPVGVGAGEPDGASAEVCSNRCGRSRLDGGVMGGARSNSIGGRLRAWLAAGMLLSLATPAAAFEYFDGRLQIHGFFENQIRLMSADFDVHQDLDLAQWYHVLSVEFEYDFAPDGWGPFDVLSAFVRLEARYDCVWTRACGMFPQADAWGNRATNL